MSLDDEIVVAIAIGIPSCLIALLSLWVTHRALAMSVRHRHLARLHFDGLESDGRSSISRSNTPSQLQSRSHLVQDIPLASASAVALQHSPSSGFQPQQQSFGLLRGVSQHIPEPCYICHGSHRVSQFVFLIFGISFELWLPQCIPLLIVG
jgi:hypothetical protein